MSKIINDDLTVVIAPAGYAAVDSTVSKTNTEPGLNLSDNTDSYAQLDFRSSSTNAYYNFNSLFIPELATIEEVSATVRANVSTGGSQNAVTVKLGYFNKEYGQSNRQFVPVNDNITISDTTQNLYTIQLSSNWDRDKLSRANILFNCSKTQSCYFYGCSLSIHYKYNGIIYEVTTENQTNLISKIHPEGLTDIYPEDHNNEYLLTLVGDSLNNITVEDNNTDVTSQLTQNQTSVNVYTVSKTPNSAKLTGGAYISTTSTTTIYNDAIGRGYDSQAATTGNKYIFHRTAQAWDSYVEYGFDFSDILFTAKIQQIEVKVKGRAEMDQSYSQVCNVRLYSGETPKSEVIDFTKTTDTVETFNYVGDWTAVELQNAILRFTFGVGGGYIVGATWTVTYVIEPDFPFYWTYRLNTVGSDHNIIIYDTYQGNRYVINTIIYYNEQVEVSNTVRYIREHDVHNETIYLADKDHTVILDNNVDVTNQLGVLSNDINAYIYTINDIDCDHVIKIIEKTHYSVICTSLVDTATVSVSAEKIYYNGNFTITVVTADISAIAIKDNLSDITSRFSRTGTNTYTATIRYVREDHEIVIIENTHEIITILSNSDNINARPNGYMSVTSGESVSIVISSGASTMMLHGRPTMFTIPRAVVSKDNIIVKDNNEDVSDQLVEQSLNTYAYTIDSVTEPHTVVIYELFVPEYEDPNYNYYSLNITSLNAVTVPGTGTIRVVEGEDVNISITPIQPVIIICTDNGEDITGLFDKTYVDDVEFAEEPSYTVSNLTTTYKFTLNNNTGYYTSTNNNIPGSQAVCRVTFRLPVDCYVEFGFINYAEQGKDYGIFGFVDTPLNASSSGVVDSEAYQFCNTEEYNQPYEISLVYRVPAGEHFIDIKYQKNSNNTSKNNDSLQWKVNAINATRPYVYYNYTVENIHDDHSLIFVFGENAYYNITSSGENVRLFPYGTMVKKTDENYTLTIIPDIGIYKLTLLDNGIDKSQNINRIESVISNELVINYIYTITRISDDHTIEIICENPYRLYFKNNEWSTITNVYKKINGEWVLIYDYNEFLTDTSTLRVFKTDNNR